MIANEREVCHKNVTNLDMGYMLHRIYMAIKHMNVLFWWKHFIVSLRVQSRRYVCGPKSKRLGGLP